MIIYSIHYGFVFVEIVTSDTLTFKFIHLGARGGFLFTLSASFPASRGLAAPLQLGMRNTGSISSKNKLAGYHFWDLLGIVGTIYCI